MLAKELLNGLARDEQHPGRLVKAAVDLSQDLNAAKGSLIGISPQLERTLSLPVYRWPT